jgi:hypothetical protein
VPAVRIVVKSIDADFSAIDLSRFFDLPYLDESRTVLAQTHEVGVA